MGPKSNKYENSFQKKKTKEISIHKMEFPSLVDMIIPDKKEELINYKNIITIEEECKKEVNENKVGWITLREGDVRSIEEENILDAMIRKQQMMDKNHEKYRLQYIELNGEEEYCRNYQMTESHLYDTEEEEEYDSE